MYKINKNYNRLLNGDSTFFLNPLEVMELKGKLNKNEYKIYMPTKDAEKVIFYKSNEPDISLYEIKTNNELRHQEILGSLFGLTIDESMFGDVIIDNGHYYVFIFNLIEDYFISNFNKIGKYNITLKKLDKNYLKDYERKYKEIEIIVTSLRIDTIISRIIKCNRDSIKDKIKDKEILLNYDFLKNNSYKLKEGDIFSIRRFGKYKFIKILNTTKKDNYIVLIHKYI
ncbi:MAG: hypothetical protein IKF37_00220 [Bacilli bacterium]|nr:hypothetical protein [Bacilli bacterium]MBR2997486.1 hypothetical protein [Bacilli bacterium]